MDPAVLDFHAASANADGPESLNACFRAAAERFGFPVYAGGQISPFNASKAFTLLNWPNAWLELYAARGFAANDVAIREALRHPGSFTWTEVRARSPGVSAQIFAAAEQFGWTEGFVVPVHGPGKRRGIISLAGAGPPLSSAPRQSTAGRYPG